MEFLTENSFLPGAASLIDQIDSKILIILRDGRHLVGFLRSIDQYMNLILEDTCERVLIPGKFCDIPLGVYIVRGDNIVMLGELDDARSKLERIEPENLSEIDATTQKIEWDFETS